MLLLSCVDLMCADGNKKEMMNCNVGAFDMVDCNVGPWDMIFDDYDVIEMANCDRVLLKDQWDISEGNPAVKKVVAECENGVCDGKNENSEKMIESVQSKLMMANLSFPCRTVLSSNPNVWLADTAATVHTTLYRNVLIATKGATVGDSITVGNGTRIATLVILSMPSFWQPML